MTPTSAMALLSAFPDRAHAVAHLQAECPKGTPGTDRSRRASASLSEPGVSTMIVDIRVGVELAASIAADLRRVSGAPPAQGSAVPAIGNANKASMNAARAAHQRFNGLVFAKKRCCSSCCPWASSWRQLSPEQALAPGSAGRRSSSGQSMRLACSGEFRRERRGVGVHAAAPRAAAPSVSTSWPAGVTSTMCSHCAESE